MANNLRDRIAAAIAKADREDWESDYQDMADAVIRELGLRYEWGLLDEEDSGFIFESLEEAEKTTKGERETLKVRAVGEWSETLPLPTE